MRTPGRLVVWVTLFLGLLAAGAITAFARKGRTRSAVALLALVPVVVEGLNVTPHPAVPAPAVPVSAIEAPLLVLPLQDYADDFSLLWATDDFPPIANGISGIGITRTELNGDVIYRL
jgi:hypothetical protein